MLSSVLNSHTAAEVGIVVGRTFVHLRQMLSTNKELAAKLEALERKISSHDQAFTGLIDAIRQLMAPSAQGKHRPIGFIQPEMSKKTKKA